MHKHNGRLCGESPQRTLPWVKGHVIRMSRRACNGVHTVANTEKIATPPNL